MKSTRFHFTVTCASLLAVAVCVSAAPKSSRPRPAAGLAKAPLVQVAILLDTSGSMSGLIEQTKSQLWRIVNEFGSARQNGRRPEVQVALYEYGKSSLAASEGYLRMIQPLTTDLDKISEELFALRTNGGEEYCGWVIKAAVEGLAWSQSANDFKAIFIAGNEPFTQGPVDYARACRKAIEHGIIVNTIHCGAHATGVATQWQDGALMAEGKYMAIDHNRAVVHFEAPQDKDIARLGEELNRTYIAYGANGQEGQVRQRVQDANATSLFAQGSAVERATCKASANYRNGSWDLVDAWKDGKVIVAEVKPEELPAEMQAMTAGERQAFVERKTRERAKLQQEINRLNAERTKYVSEQMKQHGQTDTLDAVMIAAIREQAVKRDYKFE